MDLVLRSIRGATFRKTKRRFYHTIFSKTSFYEMRPINYDLLFLVKGCRFEDVLAV
jgi:hypothetical protein